MCLYSLRDKKLFTLACFLFGHHRNGVFLLNLIVIVASEGDFGFWEEGSSYFVQPKASYNGNLI